MPSKPWIFRGLRQTTCGIPQNRTRTGLDHLRDWKPGRTPSIHRPAFEGDFRGRGTRLILGRTGSYRGIGSPCYRHDHPRPGNAFPTARQRARDPGRGAAFAGSLGWRLEFVIFGTPSMGMDDERARPRKGQAKMPADTGHEAASGDGG